MIPVSAFFSRLLPHVRGCPEPLAQQAVVDAAIEFCDVSLVVAVDLDPVTVEQGVSQYSMDLPAQTQLAQVLYVWYDDKLLEPVPSVHVTKSASIPGTPARYYTRDVDETLLLTLSPTPDKNLVDGLKIRVALRPIRTATQLHSTLLNEWADVIVDSAMSRVMDVPDQPFTNESKALMLRQKARVKTNAARVEGLRGRVVSSTSVTMRGF